MKAATLASSQAGLAPDSPPPTLKKGSPQQQPLNTETPSPQGHGGAAVQAGGAAQADTRREWGWRPAHPKERAQRAERGRGCHHCWRCCRGAWHAGGGCVTPRWQRQATPSSLGRRQAASCALDDVKVTACGLVGLLRDCFAAPASERARVSSFIQWGARALAATRPLAARLLVHMNE